MSHLFSGPVSSDARGPAEPKTFVALLVDDDDDLRALIRDGLEIAASESGAAVQVEILEVTSGEAAVELLAKLPPGEARPNLVIMDVEMPGIGGIEAARRIKHNIATCAIPVVMLSSVIADETLNAAACAGANSYLVKPASADALIDVVAKAGAYWIGVHRQARTGSGPHLHGAKPGLLPAADSSLARAG